MSPVSRRDFVKQLGLGAAALAATGSLGHAQQTSPQAAPARPAAGGQRPNILLILSDDHSFPHVGCYNNPDIKTPNLDKFAAEGMRFDAAFVTCPQCAPSRSSIMTGRSPIATGMTRFSAPLPAEFKVFPELLRAAGYFSGVCGRTYHLDGSGNGPAESEEIFAKYGLKTFPKRLDYVKGGNSAQGIVQFKEFLDLAKGKPFCVQVCSNDPHRPLDANAIPEPHDPAKLKLPGHYPDTRLVREDFARYYDEISRFDGWFGQLMQVLEERGLKENTLVMFMGDNGSSQLRGKGTLYEFGIHVPLLARWPAKIKPGSVASQLVSGEDLAPTFLEAAGEKPLPTMTGKSFLNLLLGKPYEERKYIFAERGAHGGSLPNGSGAFDLIRCVRSKKYKLIYNALWQIPYSPVDCAGDPFWKEMAQMNAEGKLTPDQSRVYFQPTRPMFELYDLEADPSEFNNLFNKPEAGDVRHELLSALQEWMILERDYVPLPIPANPRPQAGAAGKGGRGKKGQGKKGGKGKKAGAAPAQPAAE
jgi:arylsulfatase A-like enzyme